VSRHSSTASRGGAQKGLVFDLTCLAGHHFPFRFVAYDNPPPEDIATREK